MALLTKLQALMHLLAQCIREVSACDACATPWNQSQQSQWVSLRNGSLSLSVLIGLDVLWVHTADMC